MHSFVSPSAIKQLGSEATKVAKPIKVHLPQGTITPTSEVVLGATLECNKTKFSEVFTFYTLDGMEAILLNTFLDVYYVSHHF
jgi:hypothetical protein